MSVFPHEYAVERSWVKRVEVVEILISNRRNENNIYKKRRKIN